MKKADIGLIGLAVMGENLVMNMESKGFTVAVFNRTTSKVDNFVQGRAAGKNIIGCHSLEELVASLEKPRKVFMMVKAGQAVDNMIEQLLPLLEDGDILIDGGNSRFPDTIRRTAYVESQGKLYVGTGVSGGEEGALKGPSMMPGGSPAAWPYVKPIFQAICAKVEDGSPCCDWVGENGAGHFVKMVHNGIEYGDMQLICEAYQLMRDLLRMSDDEMHEVFKKWNETELDSYLIEITRDILAYKDEDGEPIVEKILDTAGQKGTGKWTGIAALDEGVPLTLIGEAVFARCLSAMKEERVEAARTFRREIPAFTGDKEAFIEAIRQALFASKIISYAQGYTLMRTAAKTYGWNLNYGGIALMWRGGCIIRSVFLGKIKEAYDNNPQLSNLLLDPYFKETVEKLVHDWRHDVVRLGEVPGDYLSEITEGLWADPVSVEINRRVMDPKYDLIISPGQVVPHEVIGMSNHAKNLFVGVGGSDMINKSHMVGAVYGMERMMGRDNTPVRKIFDYGMEHFLAERPILFVLTVTTAPGGQIRTHGLFLGEGRSCLTEAVKLAQQKNIDFVEHGLKKCVVYLDPDEFKSTWLGNKAVYRTRMAMADGGELIVLAPGVEKFGEDAACDALIRKYGYRGRLHTLEEFRKPENQDLRDNMGAAAHLIHGSSDGRFSVTYAVRDISQEEIAGVGFIPASYEELAKKYNPETLRYGYNTVDGEEIYFIPNPAIGLWINRETFKE